MKLITCKIVIAALASFYLAGCAPSDGGSSSGSIENNAISATNKIEIDRDFTLQSTSSVSVEIHSDISSSNEAFLSICQEEDGGIDYENCLIRTKVDNSIYRETFTIPNHFERLSVAVWFYDVGIPPIIEPISKDQLNTGYVRLIL